MDHPERLSPTIGSTSTAENHSQDIASAGMSKSVFSQVGEELTVPRFYAGKKIFVTGATGFVGKVLIEKLLRCCPEVGAVYCLIRPKNSQDVQQRLNELTDSKVS